MDVQIRMLLGSVKKSSLERVGELTPQVHVFRINHVAKYSPVVVYRGALIYVQRDLNGHPEGRK